MAERIITLVRHGKHDRNNSETGGGDLLPMGCEQAEYVAAVIAQQFPVTQLVTSTLRRAIGTAQVIATRIPNVPYREDRVLCEAVYHIPKRNREYFEQQYGDITPATVAHHRVRMAYAYKTYVKAAEGSIDEHDVLVCHGNVIRYFIIRAMRAPLHLWTQMDVYNGSITRLLVQENGDVRLVTQNEVSHLPRHLWTTA